MKGDDAEKHILLKANGANGNLQKKVFLISLQGAKQLSEKNDTYFQERLTLLIYLIDRNLYVNYQKKQRDLVQ